MNTCGPKKQPYFACFYFSLSCNSVKWNCSLIFLLKKISFSPLSRNFNEILRFRYTEKFSNIPMNTSPSHVTKILDFNGPIENFQKYPNTVLIRACTFEKHMYIHVHNIMIPFSSLKTQHLSLFPSHFRSSSSSSHLHCEILVFIIFNHVASTVEELQR